MSRLRNVDRAWLGGAGLVVATTVFVLVFARVPQNLLAPKGTLVRAVVANPLGLTNGDPVRVDGVEVGKVRGIELGKDARSATVKFGVRDGGLPVYRDAAVAIRERTLLGANFVVDLDRGTPSAGRLGSRTIRATRSQVELEDIANVFGAGPRTGLRSMLTELPKGLADASAPREDLRTLADVSPDLDAGLGAARGQRDGDLRRLVANSDKVVEGLDTSTDAIRDVVEGAAATLSVTAARRAEIRRSLRTAAPLLPRVRRTLAQVDTTLDLADPLIAKLRPGADELDPTVSRLRPVLTGADRLLARARPLLRSLRPTAASLADTAKRGTPVLKGLTPSIERVQVRILRDLGLTSPESRHTTFQMIGPAIAGVVGASAGYDRNNNFIRFLASGGEKAVQSAPCSTSFVDPTAASPVNCDLLLDSIDQVFGTPKP